MIRGGPKRTAGGIGSVNGAIAGGLVHRTELLSRGMFLAISHPKGTSIGFTP